MIDFLNPERRIYWPCLLAAVVLAVAVQGRRSSLFDRKLWLHRSAVLDYQLYLLRLVVRWAGVVPLLLTAYAVAVAVVRGLDGTVGAIAVVRMDPLAVTVLYTGVLFVASDLSRYVVHLLLHRVPALWDLHQVHHSAEVLTPITFYRTHPIEGALYTLRGVLVTGVVTGLFFWLFRGAAEPWQLLGVGGVGFLFNLVGGNLRHSHVWLRYPAAVERILISPAQHQIHHADDPVLQNSNYGSYLALWDWLGGSLQLAGPDPDLSFGVRAGERNHEPDDLVSALVGPVVAVGRRLTPRPSLVALVLALGLLPWVAQADDEVDEGSPASDPDEEDDEADEADEDGEAEEPAPTPDDGAPAVTETVSIFGERPEVPRVAGSAHTVEQESLERQEHDDIHRVLAPVPGVYVRGEDGYGLRPNIGLRGASSDRSAKVTLMEDGVLLAPAPYSAPAAYYFPLATRMVGVEVFKGPASILHGPNTVGGAINMQTRDVPADLDGLVEVAVGTERSLMAHAWGGVGWGFGGVLLEGVQLRTDGFKELDGDGPTGFDKSEVMLKVRLHTPPQAFAVSSWTLKLGWASERSRETYLGLADADFEATPYRRYAASQRGLMAWQRTQAELRWRLQLGDAVSVSVVGYHHYLDRSWTKLNRFAGGPAIADVLAHPEGGQGAVYAAILRGEEDSVTDDQLLLVGTNHRRFHAWGVQATASWTHRWSRVSQELEVGVRLHGDSILRDHTEDPFSMTGGVMAPTGDPTHQATLSTASATALAVHVHEELAVGPVRLVPGVRLEAVRTGFVDDLSGEASDPVTRVVVLPGLGVHVQPIPALGVLAGVHRGFSPVAPGQPVDVKPESSWNYEGGARFAFRGTHIEAIGFFNDYRNLTGTCTFSGGCGDDQVGQQFSAGRVHVYGAEALFNQAVRLPAQLELKGSVSYTWTGSSFQTGFRSESPMWGTVREGDKLPYVPEHQGAASLAFLWPFGSVEASLSVRSALRDVPGQGEIAALERVPASAVVDLATELRISRNVLLYATLQNLGNSRYAISRRPFGLRPGRPFHVMVGVKLVGRGDRPGLVEVIRGG